MNPLRRRQHPHLLQIATRPWLARLRRETGRALTLAEIPDRELDRVASLGMDCVWLTGMWTTGPRARRLALTYPDLLATYERQLPDWEPADVGGSMFSISAYEPPAGTGGRDALQHLRRRLNERGLALMLDFVPNHMGIDHPWLDERPELLIQGTARDLAREPDSWFVHTTPAGEDRIFAHGRDPHFAGWSDTVQIELRTTAGRAAMVDLFCDLASLADGLRCDVAMLVLQDVFEETWGAGGAKAAGDLWAEAIPAARRVNPDLALLAEVYWGREDQLLSAGFDWAYDKDLRDHVIDGQPKDVRDHVNRPYEHHVGRARFLENHDEARAWTALGAGRLTAAATLIHTLPGLRFFQDGEAEGYELRTPPQLARAAGERGHDEARELYSKLFEALADEAFHAGRWSALQFESEELADGLIGSAWVHASTLWIAVGNLGAQDGRGHLVWPGPTRESGSVVLVDVLTGEEFKRDWKSLAQHGLYTEVPAGGAHLFRVSGDGSG